MLSNQGDTALGFHASCQSQASVVSMHTTAVVLTSQLPWLDSAQIQYHGSAKQHVLELNTLRTSWLMRNRIPRRLTTIFVLSSHGCRLEAMESGRFSNRLKICVPGLDGCYVCCLMWHHTDVMMSTKPIISTDTVKLAFNHSRLTCQYSA